MGYGFFRQAIRRDLAVIMREKLFIIFQRHPIVAFPSEAATLRQPFIFSLGLCA
ncbi:hypothetical protein C4K23_5914 [Pseudomonas chlororaphis]|nr:hypothetical protein C4K23_5914 [Pseudomonas chlororaphis]